MAAYRASVPVSALQCHPEIKSKLGLDSINLWYDGGIEEFVLEALTDRSSRVGDNAHVMSYGIVGGEQWNIVATIRETRSIPDWDAEENVSVAHMQSCFKAWDPL